MTRDGAGLAGGILQAFARSAVHAGRQLAATSADGNAPVLAAARFELAAFASVERQAGGRLALVAGGLSFDVRYGVARRRGVRLEAVIVAAPAGIMFDDGSKP